MNYVHLTATVDKDGSLTIPAFAVRGLGYKPCTTISLALPTETCSADCADSELLIRKVCDNYKGEGYTTEGEEVNIPLELLQVADICAGGKISVLTSDGMLIIAATSDERQRDLTDELGCFMSELGYEPECIETLTPALPF